MNSALQPVKIAVLFAFLCWAWRKEEWEIAYSIFDQATFACPHFSANQVEMITQETNPV